MLTFSTSLPPTFRTSFSSIHCSFLPLHWHGPCHFTSDCLPYDTFCNQPPVLILRALAEALGTVDPAIFLEACMSLAFQITFMWLSSSLSGFSFSVSLAGRSLVSQWLVLTLIFFHQLIHFHAVTADSDTHEFRAHISSLHPLPGVRLIYVFDILPAQMSSRLLKLNMTGLEPLFHFLQTCFPPTSSCFIEGHHHLLSCQAKILETFLDYLFSCPHISHPIHHQALLLYVQNIFY